MDEGWEKKVRERAYAVWEQQGRPEGHAEQFWDMAERQLLGEGHRPGEEADRARADERGGPRPRGRGAETHGQDATRAARADAEGREAG